MGQEVSGFWDCLLSFIPLIPVGVFALFFAVYRYRKRHERELPDIKSRVLSGNSASRGPGLVNRYVKFEFNLPDEAARSKWLINAVRVAKSRRKWLAEPGMLHKLGLTYIGHELGSEWKRQIKYDPPTNDKKIVLLHSDAPMDLRFKVRVRLRNRLSVKYWVDSIPH